MFLNTSAGFSRFFVINLFIMSFFCHEKITKLLTPYPKMGFPHLIHTENGDTAIIPDI